MTPVCLSSWEGEISSHLKWERLWEEQFVGKTRVQFWTCSVLFCRIAGGWMCECTDRQYLKSSDRRRSPSVDRSDKLSFESFQHGAVCKTRKDQWVGKISKLKDNGVKWSESHSVMSDSLQPHGLYSPWNSPVQYTGVGSCSLLQEIFPTQGSNPGLPCCRQILYQLSLYYWWQSILQNRAFSHANCLG